jgi:hypothetical protein
MKQLDPSCFGFFNLFDMPVIRQDVVAANPNRRRSNYGISRRQLCIFTSELSRFYSNRRVKINRL